MPPSFLVKFPWIHKRNPESSRSEMRAFLTYFSEKNLSARRFALMTGIFFFGFFGFHDAVFLSGPRLYALWTIRYLVMIPAGLLFLWLSFRNSRIQKLLEPIVVTLTCLCAFSMILMLALSPDALAMSNFMIGILLVTLVGYSIFRLSFFWAGITGLVIFFAYLGASPWLPMERGIAVSYALQLICGMIAGMIGAFVTETVFFREFLSLKEIEVQRQKTETLNASLEARVAERTRIYNDKAMEAEKALQRQKDVERTLRMTEKQHRDLLEIVEDACFELDLHGRVSFFNTALCRITERQPAEIRNHAIFAWLRDEDAALLRRRMADMIRTGGTGMLSMHLERPASEKIEIRFSLSPKEDGLARISGFRCVIRDMSRESRLTSALQKAREHKHLADDRHFAFLRHMTHSLRTPLNGLVGGLHLLAHPAASLSRDAALSIVALEEAAERMQRVLEDIQDYTQMAEGRWAPMEGVFSPEQTFMETCAPYRRWTEARSLDFSLECRNLPPLLQGGAQFFSRILGKLLDNALRFTETGKIEVFLGFRTIAGRSWLFMEVADTGCGMDEDAIRQAFEAPYDRIGGKNASEGLGLAFLRLMTEKIGGGIRIHSQPGKGTKVICEIPVKAAETGEEKNIPPASGEARRIRVLLAEDNLINQKITLKLLEKKGYLPDLAENGLEALEKLKTGDYDLVLMDVQMPEMDGITATRRIREGFCPGVRDLPVVAFTAHTTVQDREACLEAGMNDVITKPAKPEALYAMVEKWAFHKNGG